MPRPNTTTMQFLSALPARGATALERRIAQVYAISIRAPREGSDGRFLFLVQRIWISIRAPREGSDRVYGAHALIDTHFYPRSPRGERR